MGSSGSGRFTDYSGTGSGSPKGGGGGGKPASDDRCSRAFRVTLQDVEHSEYFARTGSVPAPGTKLSIELRKRLVAVDDSGESVGNLPISYNYLADCLAADFSYAGVISASSAGPSATIAVDFAPVQ